jgi:hypothetical protein
MREYRHPELQEEVEFISGSYLLLEEGRFPCRGKDVLFYLGIAGLNSSCCGRGGCAFAKIPGFVISWKKKIGPSGESLSEIEPVQDDEDRQEIRKLITAKYPGFNQIEFL